jgi:hypothetical protein
MKVRIVEFQSFRTSTVCEECSLVQSDGGTLFDQYKGTQSFSCLPGIRGGLYAGERGDAGAAQSIKTPLVGKFHFGRSA